MDTLFCIIIAFSIGMFLGVYYFTEAYDCTEYSVKEQICLTWGFND